MLKSLVSCSRCSCIMFVIYFVMAVTIHAIWSLPTELKECEYCRSNSARCTAGHVLRNSCVRCQCSEEHLYQCEPVSPPCDEGEENIILGKPIQARCEPHMVYVQNSLICMCSKDGYWPHEKCKVTFKTLHNPENSKQLQTELSRDVSSSSAEKCKPDSYVFQDCNVCRCNADGVVERCTQNDCTKNVAIRRTYDNVHGSCIPNNWYSLAPCQFCHCQQTNKLVCSTRSKEYRSLKLGAYNLTDCGKDLVKELNELAPEGPVNLLREGAMALPSPPPIVTTMKTLRRPQSSGRVKSAVKSRPYDANLELSINLKNPIEVAASPVPVDESDSAEETVTEALREGEQTTLGLFENDEESVEEQKPSSYVRLEDGSYKPMYDGNERASLKIPISRPSHQESLQEVLMAKGLPKEIVQILTSMPEVSQMQTMPIDSQQQSSQNLHSYDLLINAVASQNQPHVLRVNLPSVLDSIIKMALRKSMVKLDASHSCMPGTTTQDRCNFCYCLTNGKLLCTDKIC